ncbi:TetR/AcrR family transcriptional regulator [Curtobacterium flaccumfaciens pv. flaccumfaciens]|nr:TetR/AcrR family transcriptional regulator [Curtobacterium flaccumfaciens pv. flaccumfaciens]
MMNKTRPRSAMNQRQQAKTRTREQIIEAAAAAFASHGYAGTSFARVAAAMDRPKSAIGYHVFSSKHELAFAVIERQQARWAAIDSRIEQHAGLEHLLVMLTSACSDAMRCSVAAGAIRLSHELRGAGEALPRTFVWDDYVRGHLLAATGGAGPAADPEWARAADLVLTSTFGVMWARTSARLTRDTEGQLRDLWAALFTGVGLPGVHALLEQVQPVRVGGDPGLAEE